MQIKPMITLEQLKKQPRPNVEEDVQQLSFSHMTDG